MDAEQNLNDSQTGECDPTRVTVLQALRELECALPEVFGVQRTAWSRVSVAAHRSFRPLY